MSEDPTVEQAPQGIDQEATFRQLLKFVSSQVVICLIDKSAYDGVSDMLRGEAYNASMELINELGVSSKRVPEECFLFSDENFFFHGAGALKEKITQSVEFSSYSAPPALLLEKIAKNPQNVLHLNFACPGELSASGAEVRALQDLAMCVGLLGFAKVCYLANEEESLLAMEVDGKSYATIFLAQEDASKALEDLKDSKYQIMVADTKTFLNSIAMSEFEGVVFSPGTRRQRVLVKKSFSFYTRAADYLLPAFPFTPSWFKQQFRQLLGGL